MTGPGEGLRERKKRATRQALTDAALRLALDQGLEHLTVEEISEAADVSPRTFFNYFSSKEEAILGDDLPRVDRERAAQAVRGSADALDGLSHLAESIAAETGQSRERIRMRRELMERYPALIPRMFAAFGDFEAALAAAVALRDGGSPEDARPQLTAAIAVTALRVAVRRWALGHGDQPLERHVSEMFRLLREELAGPGDGERRPG